MEQRPPEQPAQAAVTTIPTPPIGKPLTKRTPRSLIVFLLFVFPPLAWFFICLDKTYHHWFPKLLISLGILALLWLGVFYFTIYTQLAQLYAAVAIKNPNETYVWMLFIGGTTTSILQILYAVYLQRILKKHNSLNNLQLAISITFLIIASYLTFAPMLTVIAAIYPAVNALYQGAY